MTLLQKQAIAEKAKAELQKKEMERVEKLQLIRPHNESRVQFRRARYMEKTEDMKIMREKLKSDQEERERRLQFLRNQVQCPLPPEQSFT